MKYLKILTVAAVAAAALMAFVGSASATVVEFENGKTAAVGTTLTSMLKEGEAILKSSFIGEVKCKNSTVEGEVTNAGGATETVKGKITNLTFGECNAKVEVLKNGTLEIHATGEGNGTLTSNGTEVTTELSGIHCIFTTNNTNVGTVTGAMGTAMQVFTAKSAAIPRTGGRSGAFCGTSASWNATYEITSTVYNGETYTNATIL